MLEETILLKPELDKGGLEKMFRDLNKRFSNVAKAFGKGMSMVTKAAPYLAIASTIAAKFLNPIEKAEAIIDKILGKSGDLTDTADELGTTPGKLARLEALGNMKGVDNQTMRTLLGKFQTDLAQERENMRTDPNAKPGLLRNFVGVKDNAEAFFQFIQSLQNVSPEERTLAQTAVFGERIRGRASPFFNEKDFATLLSKLPSEATYNDATKYADTLGDRLDIIKTINEEKNYIKKAPMLKGNMIEDIGRAQQQAFDADTQTLLRYASNKEMFIQLMAIANRFDKAFTKLVDVTAPTIIEGIKKLGDILDLLSPKLEKAAVWAQEKWGELTRGTDGKWSEFIELFRSGKWMPRRVEKK